MAEQPIIRTDIIRVNMTTIKTDNYGHLHFQDVAGNEYTLSKKRSAMYSIVSQSKGEPIKLAWASYDGKDYIALVSLANVVQNAESKKTTNNNTQPPSNQVSGPEKGMIMGEIGENFRVGIFTEQGQPELWDYYKKEISRVTGVKVS